MTNGKGSKRRPTRIDARTADANWEATFRRGAIMGRASEGDVAELQQRIDALHSTFEMDTAYGNLPTEQQRDAMWDGIRERRESQT